MAWKDRLSGILILIFSGVTLYLALRVPMGKISKPGPGVFPLLLSLVIGLLALLLTLRSLSPKKQPEVEAQEKTAHKWGVLYLLGNFCLYAFLFRSLGFIISTSVFLIALKPIIKKKWIPVLLGSLFISLSFFLFFYYLLKVELPMGILEK
jgi:putative tricarboxylic transport membrane protein